MGDSIDMEKRPGGSTTAGPLLPKVDDFHIAYKEGDCTMFIFVLAFKLGTCHLFSINSSILVLNLV